MPQNKFCFYFFWKILSPIFLGNNLKWKSIVIDISPPVLYLVKFWFLSYGPKCCQPIKLQDSLKCNIFRKKWMTKFIFGRSINIQLFYKLILSFWVCVIRHAQSTQFKKFGYLCNISRVAWGMKLIFCLEISMKVFYKLIVSLWVYKVRHAQSTQNNKFEISLQYLQKSMGDEVDFCLLIDMKVVYMVLVPLWVCVARHAQSTQNSKFVIAL